jgi:ankyrin repeat protein
MGTTPLLAAAYSGSLGVVTLLVSSGADVNARNKVRPSHQFEYCIPFSEYLCKNRMVSRHCHWQLDSVASILLKSSSNTVLM